LVVERLISSDSHANISDDRVKAYLPTRYHAAYDDAQHAFAARMDARGVTEAIESMMSNSNARIDRPGHSDARERLKDMDLDGVSVEVVYSEASGFRYLGDMKEGIAEAACAFNQALGEFASADPQRLVMSYQIQVNDIDAAVGEVQRVAAEGGRSLQLPVFPSELGLPDYFARRYDRLWSAIQDTGLPICCHIGLNTQLDDLFVRDPTPSKGIMPSMTELSTAEALGMWILTGTLERFPGLKLVFVEPGLGWVPWWLNLVDDQVLRQGYRFPDIKELPSFYFHRNIWLTYIYEPESIRLLRHHIGVDKIMWSTDYPHAITSWPNSQKLAEESLHELPADEREAILSGNATRVWRL
jgi:uncharacterized protein